MSTSQNVTNTEFLESHIEDLPKDEFRLASLNNLVLKLLPPTGTVLDFGCGGGHLVEKIQSKHQNVQIEASEVVDVMLKNLTKRFQDKVTVIDYRQKTLVENHYDCIYSLDVLEHIEDDRQAFKDLYRALKVGGKLLVNVPAHMSIFSDFDTELGHYRRYEKYELEQKLKDAGFHIVNIRFWNRLGLSVIKYTQAKKLKRPNAVAGQRSFAQNIVNFMLTLYFSLIENNIPPGDGLSLIAIAQK